MRKWNWLGMAMMAVLMSMNLISCSQENDAVLPEQPAEEYVTVNLGVTGEYLELSESPLGTRAEGELKDLIGIQVYTVNESGGETEYANGLFTSLDDVSIKLVRGHKYKFETSIIVDGCSCDLYAGHICSAETFLYQSSIENKFIYSSKFLNLYTTWNYKYDRFYGELTEYTPIENDVVTITTKRVAYGAHYIAEGLTEGYLNIDVTRPNCDIYYGIKISSDASELNGIYTFSQILLAWSEDEYYSTKQLIFKWIKDDGSEIPLGTYGVTFKRNVKTTIRIKVAEPGFQNGIVITREETAMTDDENEYVIEVEDGTITEVPVTQE